MLVGYIVGIFHLPVPTGSGLVAVVIVVLVLNNVSYCHYHDNVQRAYFHHMKWFTLGLALPWQQVVAFGCTAFALLFDDIEADMCDADCQMFESFARAQVFVANTVYEHLQRPATFLFCPTGMWNTYTVLPCIYVCLSS